MNELNDKPKVSVVMTSYNRASLLPRAIESVLGQSFNNFEFIIVDDASIDDSRGVIESYRRVDSRIKPIINQKNRGQSYSRNIGLMAAKGHYITGLDDDDWFNQYRIERFINVFDENRYSFLCDNILIYEDDKYRRAYKNGPLIIRKDMILKKNHVGNQIFTLTERLRSIGGMDETLGRQEDYDTWTRMIIKYGPALRLDEGSYCMDMRHGGPRVTTETRDKAADSFHRYYIKYRDEMSLRTRIYHRIRLHYLGIDTDDFTPLDILIMPNWSRKQKRSVADS